MIQIQTHPLIIDMFGFGLFLKYADIFGLLMVQPSAKMEEPSTSTPVVDESDNENAD